MRNPLPQSPVDLVAVCRELKAMYDDPKMTYAAKADAIWKFKQALRDKLDFPACVLLWDHDAVMLYAGCIVEIG
jgi:hypothetical protein